MGPKFWFYLLFLAVYLTSQPKANGSDASTTSFASKNLCGQKAFNSTYQACCSNVITNFSYLAYRCCDTKPYIPGVQACCLNNETGTRQLGNFSQLLCCGSKPYDGLLQACCQGVLGSTGQTACCANQPYNPLSKVLCCANATRNTTSGQTACCGFEPYNPNLRACCNGVLGSRGQTLCCGSTPYAPNNFTCCLEQAGRNSSLCCGTQAYDASLQACCGGINVGQVGELSCCGLQPYVKSPGKLCCSKQLLSNLSSVNQTECCGPVPFDPAEGLCLNGTLFTIHKSKGARSNSSPIWLFSYVLLAVCRRYFNR